MGFGFVRYRRMAIHGQTMAACTRCDMEPAISDVFFWKLVVAGPFAVHHFQFWRFVGVDTYYHTVLKTYWEKVALSACRLDVLDIWINVGWTSTLQMPFRRLHGKLWQVMLHHFAGERYTGACTRRSDNWGISSRGWEVCKNYSARFGGHPGFMTVKLLGHSAWIPFLPPISLLPDVQLPKTCVVSFQGKRWALGELSALSLAVSGKTTSTKFVAECKKICPRVEDTPCYSLIPSDNQSYGYGSIPINTIFRGMNIHLPAILMFTRGTRFWHTAIYRSSGFRNCKLLKHRPDLLLLLRPDQNLPLVCAAPGPDDPSCIPALGWTMCGKPWQTPCFWAPTSNIF